MERIIIVDVVNKLHETIHKILIDKKMETFKRTIINFHGKLKTKD